MWAFTGYPEWAKDTIITWDISVDFNLREGSTPEPTKFLLIVDVGFPGSCRRVKLDGCLGADSGLVEALMTLQNTPDSSPHPTYNTSVVWSRESFGSIVGFTSLYEVIQIIDGEGTKLHPAYDGFVAQEKDRTYVTTELKSQVHGPRCPKTLWGSISSIFRRTRNPQRE